MYLKDWTEVSNKDVEYALPDLLFDYLWYIFYFEWTLYECSAIHKLNTIEIEVVKLKCNGYIRH